MPASLAPKKLHQAQNIFSLDVTTTLKPHWYYSYLLKPLWMLIWRDCWDASFAGTQKTATGTKYPTPGWRQHFKIARVPVVLAQNCWRGRFGGGAGVPASLAPKKLHLTLIFLPPDGASTLILHGCQSYLLKTVGGADFEGLLGCQLRWHPKNCIWHLFSNPQMALFKKRRSTALRIGPESLTSGFQPNRTKFRPILH